ncbi:MAG: CDP-alcohol phosphatidyltransferase family protein [Chloroflexota bacterium]
MGIYSTKSNWQKALRPIVAFCVRNRVHPDVFTYGALGLSLLAAFAFLRAGSSTLWLWLAPPSLLLRLLFNLMDGLVAREIGLADAWGEVKNEFGDRLADSAIFLGLVFGGYADSRWAALALALILCVSYLGILGKALGGARVYGGLFGKGDRMISLALFTLYPLFSGNLAGYNWYLALAALAAAITVVQRLRIIYVAQSSR